MSIGTAGGCANGYHDVPHGARFCVRCGADAQAATGATQRLNTGQAERLPPSAGTVYIAPPPSTPCGLNYCGTPCYVLGYRENNALLWLRGYGTLWLVMGSATVLD